jgi:hypothetical protein
LTPASWKWLALTEEKRRSGECSTSESVALRGLRGLADNTPLKLSRPLLGVPYLLSKWLPVRLGLVVGGLAMRK